MEKKFNTMRIQEIKSYKFEIEFYLRRMSPSHMILRYLNVIKYKLTYDVYTRIPKL